MALAQFIEGGRSRTAGFVARKRPDFPTSDTQFPPSSITDSDIPQRSDPKTTNRRRPRWKIPVALLTSGVAAAAVFTAAGCASKPEVNAAPACVPLGQHPDSVQQIAKHPEKYIGKKLLILPTSASLVLGHSESARVQGATLPQHSIFVEVFDPKTHKEIASGKANLDFITAIPYTVDANNTILLVAPEFDHPNKYQKNLQQGIIEIQKGAKKGVMAGAVEVIAFRLNNRIQKDWAFIDARQGLISNKQSFCKTPAPKPSQVVV